MQSKECRTKRTIVLRLDSGADLLLSIKRCAEEHNIRSGYITAIGGLKEVVLGLFEGSGHRTIRKKANNCFEMLSLAGNISVKEGQVLVHCHLNLGAEGDGAGFGGHLLEGSMVHPFAEIFMNEIDIELGRRHDPKIDLWPMVI